MITLYGTPLSRAIRVVWMLKELGVEYEHVPTGFHDGGTEQAEFLAINPNGRVPALVDDGQAFFESLAINLYLARKYGDEIAPRDFAEEGLAAQWTMWVVTEIEKPLFVAAADTMIFPEPDRDPAERDLMLGKLHRPFTVLDNHLANRDYLMGDRFTVADLNVASVMSSIPMFRIPVTGYPNMMAWLDRCLERPAAADWKAERNHGFRVPRPQGDKAMLIAFI